MSDLTEEEIEATREMIAINKVISPEEKPIEKFKKKLLQEEVDRINKALRKMDSINLIDNGTSLVNRKSNQKKLNNAYSLIVDTKMNIENYIKQMED